MKKFYLIGVISLCITAISYANTQSFAQFVKGIKTESLAKGIHANIVNTAFKNVKQLYRVTHTDTKQYHQKMVYAQYLQNIVSKKRIADGITYIKQYHNLLQQISHKYQVPPQYIVALWGLETSYGRRMGTYPEFSALTTLAYAKRRRTFFTYEIFDALKMLQQKDLHIGKLKGSWAGAMGQCQFMPSAYLRFAVAYKHKGAPDIWNNLGDVFASTANYLHQLGWNRHETLVIAVKDRHKIPDADYGLSHSKDLASWEALGLIQKNDQGLPKMSGKYSLYAPDGKNGLLFLVNRNNFAIILKWNHSHPYALAVGKLANAIR